MGFGKVRTRSGFDTTEGRHHEPSVCKANIKYAAKFCWDFLVLNFYILDMPRTCRLYILLGLRICLYGLEGVILYALSATVVALSEGDGDNSFLVDLVELVLCRSSQKLESVQNQLSTIGPDRQRREAEGPLVSSLHLPDGLIQTLNSTFPGLISQSLLESNDSLVESVEGKQTDGPTLNQVDTGVAYPMDHATPNPWTAPTPTFELINTTLLDDFSNPHQSSTSGSFVANLCLRITNLETEEVLAYCSSTATEPLVWLGLTCFLVFCSGLLYGFLCTRYQPQGNQDKSAGAATPGQTLA